MLRGFELCVRKAAYRHWRNEHSTQRCTRIWLSLFVSAHQKYNRVYFDSRSFIQATNVWILNVWVLNASMDDDCNANSTFRTRYCCSYWSMHTSAFDTHYFCNLHNFACSCRAMITHRVSSTSCKTVSLDSWVHPAIMARYSPRGIPIFSPSGDRSWTMTHALSSSFCIFAGLPLEAIVGGVCAGYFLRALQISYGVYT